MINIWKYHIIRTGMQWLYEGNECKRDWCDSFGSLKIIKFYFVTCKVVSAFYFSLGRLQIVTDMLKGKNQYF